MKILPCDARFWDNQIQHKLAGYSTAALSHKLLRLNFTENLGSALSTNIWLLCHLLQTLPSLLYVPLQSAGTTSLKSSESLKDDETFFLRINLAMKQHYKSRSKLPPKWKCWLSEQQPRPGVWYRLAPSPLAFIKVGQDALKIPHWLSL